MTLTYVADLADIDAALAEHGAWLEQQYTAGIFHQHGLAEYAVVEFSPSLVVAGLEQLQA